MCGIVGLIDGIQSVSSKDIDMAADLLRQRGPDDSGLWAEAGIGLGHRRLSVIDVSPAGHQPMMSANGRYVIVFNGEVYNFRELKSEFPDHVWRSDSDSEVILEAYAAWGPKCLGRFRGMFAFAIWDRQGRTLFAARDRLGVKPFYYHHSASRFAFGSRPRAVLALCPEAGAEIDTQALRYYLEAGYIPAPFSFYSGIRKLPPAHYLILDAGGRIQLHRYWDFRRIEPDVTWEGRREGDLIDELEDILSRSVRYRMVSDVPVGAFLSGGIDSSLVVALMRRHAGGPVKTFTIGFEEPDYDESQHAARIAHHLNTDHHCERVKVDDLLTLLPTLEAEYDEPFADNSAIPTLAVSRMTRSKVTVSLSGDGGDELFGGYHYYHIIASLAPLFAMPHVIRRRIASMMRVLPGHRVKLLAGTIAEPGIIEAFTFARSIAKDFAPVLLPETVAATRPLHMLFSEEAAMYPGALVPAEQAMRLDLQYTLPDDYLQKVDVASMAFSLESREPLLDQELVEWAMRLPLKWKRHGNNAKYLLRRLACRLIPAPLLERPKQGFRVPVEQWLRKPLQAWARERLEARELFESLPLDHAQVLALFDLHVSGRRNCYPLLWAVLMLLGFVEKQKYRRA
jgi:asparagine synthase (glutamine-hydrolysing)